MNGSKDKPTPGSNGSAKNNVDLNELSSILDLLSSNDVTEFEIKKGDMHLSLKRGPAAPIVHYTAAPAAHHAAPAAAPHYAAAPTTASAAPQPAPTASATPSPTAAAPKAVVELTPNKQLKEITSPIVGTFYRRPAMDAEAYVDVGDTVKKGDVLCIVEAMKLMNEIEAEIGGKIAEICISDGAMVEYGETLFRIEPL